jgi:hypothetical protein
LEFETQPLNPKPQIAKPQTLNSNRFTATPKVGNELREFVLNVALHLPGVVGVCAVTRTRGFRTKQRVNPGPDIL